MSKITIFPFVPNQEFDTTLKKLLAVLATGENSGLAHINQDWARNIPIFGFNSGRVPWIFGVLHTLLCAKPRIRHGFKQLLAVLVTGKILGLAHIYQDWARFSGSGRVLKIFGFFHSTLCQTKNLTLLQRNYWQP